MTFSLDLFSPLVGGIFKAETQAGPIDLQLIEAKETPRNGLPEQFRTPLSLIFTGPLDPVLMQDNYYIEHPAIGRQVWCVAPISDAKTTRMSAVPVPAGTAQRYQVLFA